MITSLLKEYEVEIVVKKARKSKLGDFRPGMEGKIARITVNGNLNRYAFLITLLHEIAHLKAHSCHGKGIKPHGREWKEIFANIASPCLNGNMLPPDVKKAFGNYLRNPAASSTSHSELHYTLGKYSPGDDKPWLESLPQGAHFELNGRRFKKGKQLRKRFQCREVSSGKLFLVGPMAAVKIVEK